MMNRSYVDAERIVQGLRAVGVEAGMGLMVHASLKSFGHVEGGAKAVVAALMSAVSEEGTLVLPSFNHGAPFEPGGPGYFSPVETPTTNGAIPESFWRSPQVARSWNPTHAFTAWGRHSQRYVSLHHRTLTMGPDSPLGLLHADDGYCLFLGTDYQTNTFHHVVEMSIGSPCLGQRTEVYPVLLPDGRWVKGRTWGWRERSCPFTDRNRYADRMAPLHRQAQIGTCQLTLYRLRDGFRVIADILTQGRDGFPPCSQCPIRPRRVPQTTDSDWDAEHARLRPDSEALTY